MEKKIILIEEMTKEEKEQVEKEIAEGTCKVGLSAKEMYNVLVEQGVIEKKALLRAEQEELSEEQCLDILNELNEKFIQEGKTSLADEIQSRGIAGNGGSLMANLHRHMTRWAVYKPGVVPVSGNQCGYVAPATYGGLSYEICAWTQWPEVGTINTGSFGWVNIWLPIDEDHCKEIWSPAGKLCWNDYYRHYYTGTN